MKSIRQFAAGGIASAFLFTFLTETAYPEVIRVSDEEILINGPIEEGDYERLISLSAEMIESRAKDKELSAKIRSLRLRLNSPGGNVFEAIKIADFVHEMWIHVVVDEMPNSDEEVRCLSACSLIFIAGISHSYKQSFSEPTVTLGFHRPYINPEVNKELSAYESRAIYDAVETSFKEAMRRFGAPESLISKTFNHSSSEIYILSTTEYHELFPPERPWFNEYINAKCGNVSTKQKIESEQQKIDYAKAVLQRELCKRLHIRTHQAQKIQDYLDALP